MDTVDLQEHFCELERPAFEFSGTYVFRKKLKRKKSFNFFVVSSYGKRSFLVLPLSLRVFFGTEKLLKI